MTFAIHQFSAGFRRGDAISNEAVAMQRVFRSWGHASEIFCNPKRVQPDLKEQVGDVRSFAKTSRAEDIVLLHLSTGSVINSVFSELPCRKAILYHNITPPEFFRGIQERLYRSQSEGVEQVRGLAGKATVNMAVSRFNAEELTRLGFSDVKVMPLLIDLARLRERPNPNVLEQYDDGKTNILFVGRCVQNKRIEDALAAFHYFQKFVQPDSRFIHVGAFGHADPYYSMIVATQRRLLLRDVVFTGPIPQDELNALYRRAHVFLSMSEHEGFCIPLIESMVHDLPVLAYHAAAVPETLDGAGVLFTHKHFDEVAEMMDQLRRDTALRRGVIAGQRERLARYEARDLEAELRGHLAPLRSP